VADVLAVVVDVPVVDSLNSVGRTRFNTHELAVPDDLSE
jgi:hypothetical protein